jgi:hypothetical protein
VNGQSPNNSYQKYKIFLTKKISFNWNRPEDPIHEEEEE